MNLLYVCLISIIITKSMQDCNFSEKTFTCMGGDSKSMMFDYNSKNANSTIIEILEFSNLNSSSVDHFLEAVEDDVKNQIKIIRINFCEATDMPDVAKKDYPNLETMDLRNNNIENLDIVPSFPVGLKNILLGGNKISTVSDVFANFKDLEIVDLSDSDIENFDFMLFKNNLNLQLINVSRNKIEVIESEEYLKNIKCVDLSYNKLTKYRNIPSLCLDFSYTDMTGYHWYDISEQNKSVIIEKFFFSGNNQLKLLATNVKNESLPMEIKYLNISYFQGDVSQLDLENVKVRKELNLENSKLIILDKSKYDFKRLFYPDGTNATFNLYNCSISDIPSKYFEDYNLGRLNLCYNNFEKIKADVFKNAYIVELDLCLSNITEIDDDAFSDLHVYLLNLSKNKLTQINFLNSLSTVRYVDLSYNDIKTLHTNEFANLTNLEKIDLRNNDIHVIERGSFNNKKIQVIYLSNNKLSNIKNRTFVDISNLKEIYLEGNNIESIDDNAFVGLPSLQLVNLGDTEIYAIKTNAFRDVNNMEKVYLKNNEINDLHLVCRTFK